MVKVILNKDDKVLGEKGKIVEVSDGYARNFLLPRKLAVIASEGNVTHFKAVERAQAKKIAKLKQDEEALKTTIEKEPITLIAKAGANKRLFGSITNEMIAVALHEQRQVEVDKRRVVIPDPVKQLGKYTVQVKLKYNIVAQAKIEVVPEETSETEDQSSQ